MGWSTALCAPPQKGRLPPWLSKDKQASRNLQTAPSKAFGFPSVFQRPEEAHRLQCEEVCNSRPLFCLRAGGVSHLPSTRTRGSNPHPNHQLRAPLRAPGCKPMPARVRTPPQSFSGSNKHCWGDSPALSPFYEETNKKSKTNTSNALTTQEHINKTHNTPQCTPHAKQARRAPHLLRAEPPRAFPRPSDACAARWTQLKRKRRFFARGRWCAAPGEGAVLVWMTTPTSRIWRAEMNLESP